MTTAPSAREQTAPSPSRADDASAPLSARAALDATLRRLAGFGSLAPDWDSHGAKVPQPVAIQTAADLLALAFASRPSNVGEERALPSWVSPLPNGGVQIDWNGSAAELEVDVDPSGRIGYLLQQGQGSQATYHEADDVSPEQVLGLLTVVLRP